MPDIVKVPQEPIDTIRMLALDAVQKANAGHPGTPMGAAEMTLTLWTNFLRFNSEKPDWQDRDRFVLSVGHASMLLYSLLHLFGYDCSMDDIKQFRQAGSRTAGHPEYGHLQGIETTTGPLGQGIANAVGLALGQALLKGHTGAPLKGHTWCLAGDGCMMEGISYEAASLAGHLGLNNLTLIYDQNHITIDGSTDQTFTENTELRFKAAGWDVIKVDGYDQAALCQAFAAARDSQEKPTLIISHSIIGKGSATMEGTAFTHGNALGEKEVAATKQKLGWPSDPFHVSEETRAWFKAQVALKKKAYDAWATEFEAWRKAQPAAAGAYDALWSQKLPLGFESAMIPGMAEEKGSTRKLSGKAIQALAKQLPSLIGGSADLAENNFSLIRDGGTVGKADGVFKGRNIYYGIREHAMGSITNGLALHGAWRPLCATFMQFSDYMRPSIRLAALMKARSIFDFTHDSVFLGEDGPTHQPVEHLNSLRLIPGLTLWRPAEGLETAMAWAWTASEARGPVAFAFTRQNVPTLPFAPGFDPKQIWKGGYVFEENAAADLSLVATGSEVALALEASKLLAAQGIKCRIVSMPSVCVFGRQDEAYRKQVLGSKPRVAIEAGSTGLWASIVGSESLVIGIDQFGMSAKLADIQEHFGFTPPQVAEKVRLWLAGKTAASAAL
jgi:transketolase